MAADHIQGTRGPRPVIMDIMDTVVVSLLLEGTMDMDMGMDMATGMGTLITLMQLALFPVE